eukprot:5889109-Amphidinium_carterae.1
MHSGRLCGHGSEDTLLVSGARLTSSRDGDLTPDIVCFNAAMSACERSGQWEQAGIACKWA